MRARFSDTDDWQGWVDNGTIEVTAHGNRGEPWAWHFIGPLPEGIEPRVDYAGVQLTAPTNLTSARQLRPG